MRTSLTELVGCKHPIQQAVMGGISGRQLAAAVASAGGIGMLHSFGPLPIKKRMAWVTEHVSGGVWGVGFRADKIEENREAFALAAECAPVVELCWSTPDPDLVRQIHGGGGLVFWQLGSVEAAIAAAEVGVDVIVAQGSEAGGHLCGDTPLLILLDGILNAVEIPVIAAGGITTADAMAAALAAGAAGVRIGTLFAASHESDASDEYRRALIAAESGDSVVTTQFGAEWPNAPHRVLRACIAAAQESSDDPIGVYADGTDEFEIPRFSTLAPTRYSSGPHDAMAMYAGTGVGAIRKVDAAAKIVQRMASQSERLLKLATNLIT